MSPPDERGSRGIGRRLSFHARSARCGPYFKTLAKMAIVAFPEHPFDEIAWKDDRLQLRDLVFEVEGRARAQRSSGEAGFVLLKPKRVIDQYAQSVSV